MKLLYLTPGERLKDLVNDWHALDLGNGHHLVCVRWRDEASEMAWSEHPDVIPLPHPIFQSTAVIPDEHLVHLRGRFTLQDQSNVHHVIKEAAKEDPWMRLHVL
jgi:hypothetical protein